MKTFSILLLLLWFLINISGYSTRTTPTTTSIINNNNDDDEDDNAEDSSSRHSTKSVTALVDQSISFTCLINLDRQNFSTSANYQLLWSRENLNNFGHQFGDYDPLYVDDTRLTSDLRFHANRLVIKKDVNDDYIIKWTLNIINLRLNDSNFYICQLNMPPYDQTWLKRFKLEVYAPAQLLTEDSQQQEEEQQVLVVVNNDSLYTKSVKENDSIRLKCLARGRPEPNINWYLKYKNGTIENISFNKSEILIENIQKEMRFNRIECQAHNGVGASASRLFKINVLYEPQILSKSQIYRVFNNKINKNDLKLNCTVSSNPLSKILWYYSMPLNSSIINSSSIHLEWSLITSSSHRIHEYESSDGDTIVQSILTIKTAMTSNNNDDDDDGEHHDTQQYFGIYRCLALNTISNKTIDFTIEELKSHHHHIHQHHHFSFIINTTTTATTTTTEITTTKNSQVITTTPATVNSNFVKVHHRKRPHSHNKTIINFSEHSQQQHPHHPAPPQPEQNSAFKLNFNYLYFLFISIILNKCCILDSFGSKS